MHHSLRWLFISLNKYVRNVVRQSLPKENRDKRSLAAKEANC